MFQNTIFKYFAPKPIDSYRSDIENLHMGFAQCCLPYREAQNHVSVIWKVRVWGGSLDVSLSLNCSSKLLGVAETSRNIIARVIERDVSGSLHKFLEESRGFRLIDWILTSHSSATRGLLATDHVILNHGQVTWTTPELAPPSPNYHTTPTGGRFSSRQI
ncbi:hypothetical protein TNCV_1689141 [Trichonephila clavipes]|nr:hypothetical protein TNCV_1689141 [Trichonephila clavipes]